MLNYLTCDVAIIGAGTAGLGAWTAATQAGAEAIIIESGTGGTTCARIGCMPSKLMIEAAKIAHVMRTASRMGIEDAAPRIDGAAILRHVRKERDHFTIDVFEKFDSIQETRRVRGQARFLSQTRLGVDDHTIIDAKAVIIATGSSAAVLPIFEPVRDLVLTNANVFELDNLPASLAVVGAGAVGLELAQAFARLGVRVRLFDKSDRLGGLDDPEVNASAAAALGEELHLTLSTDIKVSRDGNDAVIEWVENGKPKREAFGAVLAAAGRPPNLKWLDLSATGLKLDEHGVPCFDKNTLRCGDSSIYIAGDASGFRPVLHEASYAAKITGRNAAQAGDQAKQRGCAFAVTFSDPQIAVVGPKFSELPKEEIAIGAAKFKSNGRARIEGYSAGLIRLYGRTTDHALVGGQMIGPGAEHLAHLLAWLVDLRIKAPDATTLPFYHPTLEEALRAALRALCTELGVTPRERRPCFESPPGILSEASG